MTRITTIAEMQALARRRVPRMFYEYVASGSWSESTKAANEGDFERLMLRQRVAVDVSRRTTSTRVFGEPVTMPVAIAPTGLAGMQYPDGEIHAARAAVAFGVPYTLSTMSICSIEDVSRALGGHTFWFQLYLMRDRGFVADLIARAEAARCPVLVLTVDLPVIGQRHRDVKNGLGAPPRLGVRSLLDMMRHPRWCLSMLRTRRYGFGNIVGHVDGVQDLATLAEWTEKQFSAGFTWADVEWVRARWPGKLVIKGIQDAADARSAVAAGADAIIVSNHGGRQLDGTVSSISALPAVVDAIGNAVGVHLDGGIRSGQDVLRALALGAQCTYIGRPHLYGLGARGPNGVREVLEIIQRELELTMALCGCTSLREITPGVLLNRPASMANARA